MDVDVLVVGAGPTGLALAAQLQRYGVRFRIIDRALDRVRESRALAVQPRTLEVLAGLGVTDKMVERGNQTVRLQMHAGRRVVRIELFDIGIDDTAYPYLLFLSQAETERILGDYLAGHGVSVERGVELGELSGTDDAVSCLLRHHDGREESVGAGYVVGCDGAHSTVRELAGIAFEVAAYPQTFVLADVDADGLEPGAAHAFMASRGLLFFFPLGSPAPWRMLAMRPRSDPAPVERPVTLGEVQALLDAYVSTPVRLRDPVWMTIPDVIHDHTGEASRRLGLRDSSGAHYLIRPDGHIGYRSGGSDLAGLRTYLDRWLNL